MPASTTPFDPYNPDDYARLPYPLYGYYMDNVDNRGQGQLHAAMGHLAEAIVAMQFQDMASQLIAHTTRRLRSCADRVARDAMGDDDDAEAVVEQAPVRPNPVTQDEMDAGSVELF